MHATPPPADPLALVQQIITEGPIGMSAAARLVGTDASTVVRWATKGVMAGGRRLTLEHVRTAGKLITSRLAVARFLASQQRPPEGGPQSPPAGPRPCKPSRASEAAEELRKFGL